MASCEIVIALLHSFRRQGPAAWSSPNIRAGVRRGFVLATLAGQEGINPHFLRVFVRSVDPQRSAAGQIVPQRGNAGIALLAGAEFFQIVGRAHAGHVEEILVLANAQGAVGRAFALRRKAENVDLGLVDANRPGDRICVENWSIKKTFG